MPTPISPQPGDVHVNRPLTNISLAYMQSETAFIAGRMFPNVPVNHQSDFYYSYPKGSFFQDRMKERGLSERSPMTAFAVQSETPYFCKVWSLATPIDDRTRANVDQPLQLDGPAAMRLSRSALIQREKLFISRYFGASVWTTELTGVGATPSTGQFLKWTDANSDPVKDIRAAKGAMHLASGGRTPNKITMSKAVWDALQDHPDIIDRVKYGQTPGGPAMVTRAALAALFETEEIVVAEAIEDTSAELVVPSPTMSYIAPNHVGLFYVPSAPSLMELSAGYTFSWQGYMGATALGSRILRWRKDEIRSDIIEIEASFDMKKVSPDCGAILLNAI